MPVMLRTGVLNVEGQFKAFEEAKSRVLAKGLGKCPPHPPPTHTLCEVVFQISFVPRGGGGRDHAGAALGTHVLTSVGSWCFLWFSLGQGKG